MVRLFLTGFCVLIVTVVLAVLSVSSIEMRLYRFNSADFLEYANKGTFLLLDDAIEGRTGNDLKNTVLSVRDRFKTPVALKNIQDLKLPAKGLAVLDAGGVYLHDLGDSSYVLRRSKHVDRIWSIAAVPSRSEERIMAVHGALELAKDKLTGKSANERSQVLSQLQKYTDIPLSLHSSAELNLKDKEKARLEDQQVVVRSAANNGEIFWIQIEQNGPILQAGPVSYPVDKNYVQTILAISFITVFLAGYLFWIWLLWRDLQRLRHAARDIGLGKLDTRVHARKTSFIHSVLDGFNHMATRTENMVASQRELTNAVSHELRTPLARMMFDLEMGKQADNSQDRMRHLDNLELSVVELNTLVDELLTYAKQERVESPLELKKFSQNDASVWLSMQIKRAQRTLKGNQDIEFTMDITFEESISFSPKLMAHAMSNALQNAMRFAESRIHVELQIHYSGWILAVEDDGTGIPAHERERVFQSFARLNESRGRDTGGFGLGLAIVRKIARWHQGDARIVDCVKLSGMRLEIRWPVRIDLHSA